MKSRETLAWLVATALVAAVAYLEAKRSINGDVLVVDGDTMQLGYTDIRLFGVDAFEARQVCTRDRNPWRCGEAAADELHKMADGRPVTCIKKDTDVYGRTVAVCTNGTVDLAGELARMGLALAYRQYSDDYVDEEAEADAANRGAWAGEFTAPWDARRGRETPAAPQREGNQDVSGDCRGTGIKGNIRNGRRLYHVQESPSYRDTQIVESAGERWFCTEEEAIEAGWVAPDG